MLTTINWSSYFKLTTWKFLYSLVFFLQDMHLWFVVIMSFFKLNYVLSLALCRLRYFLNHFSTRKLTQETLEKCLMSIWVRGEPSILFVSCIDMKFKVAIIYRYIILVLFSLSKSWAICLVPVFSSVFSNSEYQYIMVSHILYTIAVFSFECGMWR